MQRVLDVSAQLQQSQADMMGSQRRTADLQKVVDESNAKVDSLEKIREQLTQVSLSVLSMGGWLTQAKYSFTQIIPVSLYSCEASCGACLSPGNCASVCCF